MQHIHLNTMYNTQNTPDTPDTDRTQNNLSTEQDTENSTQPQHTPDTDYLHKYNFDIYHEYVSIKNSNTIEIYTILQDKV